MSKTLTSILTIAAVIAIQAVPGIGQAVGAAIGLSAAAGASIATFAAVAAINLTAAALAKTPRPDTATTAIKTERPPRVSAYGRVKLFGAYTLYQSSNGTAIDVWAFHDGRIDAIEDYYLGDKKVVRLGTGYVQKSSDGAYGNNVIKIGANLGAFPETAHSDVVAALPGIWTTDHRGDGVVSGYMISKAVKAKNFQEVYPSGGPNQTPLALVMRAQLVFDWRDSHQDVTDPATWKWSENAVLHTAHYQLVRNGKTWDRHFAPTLAYWTAAADDCDIVMPLKDGGTEPRYRSCVSHRHAGSGSEHKAVINALLSCFDGWMAPREDGALVVYSGRYYEPTVTIGPDIVTSYSVEDGIEDENALNELGLTYVSSEHDLNVVDTDPWVDEADVLARGEVRADELANQVPSAAQARRLGKRKMRQTMAPKRGTVTTLAAGSVMLSQRFVHLTLAEGLGTDDEFVAYDGPAEITGLSRNLQSGEVSASWIAADPAIDAWDPESEEGNTAPVGDPVDRGTLDDPIISSATAILSADSGGGAPGAYIHLTVTAPDRADLLWAARTRIQGADIWGEREYSDLDPGSSVEIDTEFVPTDAMIEAEVRYQVGDGRYSEWSASAVVDTTVPPSDGGN